VDDFIHNKALIYRDINLSVIYVLRHNQDIVAYFTTSMGSIRIKDLREGETIEGGPKDYPAMLLGNMGVDKRFRDKGLGSFIYDEFCIGLARRLNKRVACRYVYIRTSKDEIGFYQKCRFIPAEKISDKGRLWMYRRIVAKHITRSIFENIATSERVATDKKTS
jgi:GNAT superfamily N-acetyltransferase